ncbi:MAG: serine hydrolase, partial [Candidatus Aminicenantes bacterium]|nr:serine hydrolase [Candidatus Aminicenantes bacterium]
KGLNNQTDALALMQILETIATGQAVSKSASTEMTGILTRQKFRAGIPAGIPEGIPAGNKTGSITGIEHDAAIVFPPGRKPYVLVILTRGVPTSTEGEKLIARLSGIVYQQIGGK